MWIEFGATALLIFLLSVVFGAVATTIVFVVVSRLPVDHFLEDRAQKPLSRTLLHKIWFVFKNALGIVLIIAGIIMIITPGPGFLSILIGLSLVDFRQKHALILMGLKRPSVRKSLNWMRKKANVPPLKFPSQCEPVESR
jgi:Putative transmembrane protein (PGPGW).